MAGVREALDVELVGSEVVELEQVERREVAGRVVQEHVLGAGVAGVDAVGVRAGVPVVDRRVELHPGVAALVGGDGDLTQNLARPQLVHRLAAGDRGRPVAAVLLHGVHEVIAHAHAVIGVLEGDGRVGLAIEGAVVARVDQGPGLAFFARLAGHEIQDVRMIGVENDHLRRATRLAAGLDDVGEGVVAAHERDRPGGHPAAGQLLFTRPDRGEIAARPAAPLEEQGLPRGQVHDRLHRVVDGVNEAGGALGLLFVAHIEPNRAVEGRVLVDQEVAQLLLERDRLFAVQEVAAVATPAADGIDDPVDQLLDRRLSGGGVLLSVEVFGDNDVGRVLRPESRHLHIALLEQHVAAVRCDRAGTPLPFDRVVGVQARRAEAPADQLPSRRRCVAGRDSHFLLHLHGLHLHGDGLVIGLSHQEPPHSCAAVAGRSPRRSRRCFWLNPAQCR